MEPHYVRRPVCEALRVTTTHVDGRFASCFPRPGGRGRGKDNAFAAYLEKSPPL